MKLSALLAPMLAAKADHALIEQVILAYEGQQTDALEQRREHERQRQARKREKSRDITGQPRDRFLTGANAHVEDNPSKLEIDQKEESKKETREAALLPEFDEFWSLFPNKVGKPKARAALRTALQKADIEVVLDGLRRYISRKPADRAWLNPATFLNQERWADQPAPVTTLARAGPAIAKTGAVIDLGERLIRELDAANAGTSAQNPGHQQAPLRLSHG